MNPENKTEVVPVSPNKKLSLYMMTKSDICALTAMCFFNFRANMPEFPNIDIEQVICSGQSDLPKSRSQQTSDWYERSKVGDIFFFIDSDQTFTLQDVKRATDLLETHDLVCGIYSRKNGTPACEPVDAISFFRNREGPILFGATGFMAVKYSTFQKIVETEYKLKVNMGVGKKSYPFFLERIVEIDGVGSNLWLSEDFTFCWLVRKLGMSVYGFLSPTIGHIIPDTRFVELPQINNAKDTKAITVLCFGNAGDWSPKSLSSGIGGSEMAVIKLTNIWAKHGYDVSVYCQCGDQAGDYDGVKFRKIDDLGLLDSHCNLIIWRDFNVISGVNLQFKKCFIDVHDIPPEEIQKSGIEKANHVMVKSKFHASLFGNQFPVEKLSVVPNGGAVELDNSIVRNKYDLVYSSSYDRGLFYILKFFFPKLKQLIPEARLHIAYGWDTFDKLRKGLEADLFKKTMNKLMSQDGIVHHGKLGHNDLLKLKSSCSIHIYTGTFQEIDCISTRESACLGAVPVVSSTQRVFLEQPYVYRVDGDPVLKATQENTAQQVADLLNNDEKLNQLRTEYMEKASHMTWENSAVEWEKLFV